MRDPLKTSRTDPAAMSVNGHVLIEVGNIRRAEEMLSNDSTNDPDQVDQAKRVEVSLLSHAAQVERLRKTRIELASSPSSSCLFPVVVLFACQACATTGRRFER